MTRVAPAPSKPGRRWAKRPANPNDAFPNASLSVRDVHLIIRKLEDYLAQIKVATGREAGTKRRHVQKLVDKLREVRWLS